MTKRTATAEKQARVKALMAAGFTQREAENLYMAEISAAFQAEIQKRRDAKAA